MTARSDYLHATPDADYWTLSAYHRHQPTASACSLASVTMAVNYLRQVSSTLEEPPITPSALLERLGDTPWAEQVAHGGEGVRWVEFVARTTESLASFGLQEHIVEEIRFADDSLNALSRLRSVLAANEAGEEDMLLAYFNQGVLTGDWDGPHVSPIGAYHARSRRVLIMDVDPEWHTPYWSSDEGLLEAMLRPAPEEHGPLAGEVGGLLWLRPAVAR